MADGKQTIVIKKVKGGGGHAPHGGAWKVAFADFMTAMMAFFLVMWLMGSDEEIQSEVAEYFSNPASAWRPDLASKNTVPLGERTGSGDNLLSGLNGLAPEDLIERPSREFKQTVDAQENTTGDVDQTRPGLRPPVKMDIEVLKFSIPEHQLFKTGTDELTIQAAKYLKNLKKLVKGFKGQLEVQAFQEPAPTADAAITDPYEFSIARAVSVQQHLVKKRLIEESRIKAMVAKEGRAPASVIDGARRLQFTFRRENP